MRNCFSSIQIRFVTMCFCIFAIITITGATICTGGTIVGGPLNGTVSPGEKGGMIVGGPFNGTVLPEDFRDVGSNTT